MTSLRDELLAIDREADADPDAKQMGATKLADDAELAERRAVEGYGLPLVCPGCDKGLPEGTERCPKCNMLIRPEHHQVPDRVRTLKETVQRIRDEMPANDKWYGTQAISGAKAGKRSKAANAKYNRTKAKKEPRE